MNKSKLKHLLLGSIFDALPLIGVFQLLVDNGDTVLFIVHNRTLIDSADEVIALGSGSWADGGVVIV